jgi:integrase/recombinase XerD
MHRKRTGPTSLYSNSGQRKYLSRDERLRFIMASDGHERQEVRTLCLTLAHTGCRMSEALMLTAAMIGADEGFIAVPCLKKRSEHMILREVPVPESLLALLRTVHGIDNQAPSARVWTFSRTRAWQLVRSVMARAGINRGPQACPKGLRHGFGLHAIRSGVPLHLVQRWLGHARMETTAIYLQAMGVEEREIAARMWRADEQPPVGAATQ